MLNSTGIPESFQISVMENTQRTELSISVNISHGGISQTMNSDTFGSMTVCHDLSMVAQSHNQFVMQKQLSSVCLCWVYFYIPIFFFKFYVYGCFACRGVYASSACLGPGRSEESLGSSGVTDSCEPPCVCCEQNSVL